MKSYSMKIASIAKKKAVLVRVAAAPSGSGVAVGASLGSMVLQLSEWQCIKSRDEPSVSVECSS